MQRGCGEHRVFSSAFSVSLRPITAPTPSPMTAPFQTGSRRVSVTGALDSMAGVWVCALVTAGTTVSAMAASAAIKSRESTRDLSVFRWVRCMTPQ